jgi:hypothetical protein
VGQKNLKVLFSDTGARGSRIVSSRAHQSLQIGLRKLNSNGTVSQNFVDKRFAGEANAGQSLAELLKRTDRAKYLMKDGFKLLAVLQPATRLNAQTSQDRWLCYFNGAVFIGLQLAACPYMSGFLSSLRAPGFGLKVQLAAIQQ